MSHREETMEKLLTKLQAALEDCQSIETEIMYNLDQMGCNVLTEHDNLVTEEEITSKHTIRVNADHD